MDISRRRLIVLFAALAAWALVVVVRLAQVQLVRHDHYVSRAQRQQERTLEMNPVRGSILDSRGRVLAESVAAESIYADPQAITDPRSVARLLASVDGIGRSAREIESKLRSGGSFVYIARQLPLEVTEEVRALDLPGIYFLEAHRRTYPRGTLAAHLVGYAGIDGEGLAGVEHAFDSAVKGTSGKVTMLKDARKGIYLVGGDGPNRPLDGKNVVLTIDSVIQFIAERTLEETVRTFRATGGSVIVMEPATGDILAMASAPTFDPNHFRRFPPASWRNRAVQDLYEPGSTFKVVTAAAGLEERIVTPSQVLDCSGGAITVANITIREHDAKDFGLLSFEDVIVNSSNVGTAKVGLTIGPARFHEWIRRFGFGERTGITLPGESPGLLRRTGRWTQVSPASIAIGQEIGATPLQMLLAVSSVATGGTRVEPRIVKRIVDADGTLVKDQPRGEPKRVMSEKTAAVVNEILKNAVSRGTGSKAALAEHVVAGKTGTAQKAGRGGYLANRYVASFAGYVPADEPRLAILVMIDEPWPEHYGGAVAAPAFREIAEATLRYLGVAPSIPSRTIGIGAPQLAAFSQRGGSEGSTGVPDLRGLDARTAVARAVSRGLAVRAVGSGVVLSQNPQPGAALPADRNLMLKLGTGGPEPRRVLVDGPANRGAEVL